MEECPNCGRDNAYYDGVSYVCPDCGYEWDCPFIVDDEDEDDCEDDSDD